MKFSTYHRILQKELFFEKFFKKESKKIDETNILLVEKNYKEILDIVSNCILEGKKDELFFLLSMQNAKIARRFFDHLTCSKIINCSKMIIKTRLDEFFEENILNQN